MSTTTALAAAPQVETRQRWHFIDSLRGFAVLGILLVNAIDIISPGMDRILAGGAIVPDPVRDALFLTVQTRFVPIFVFLFGMSLWILLDGARNRLGPPDRALIPWWNAGLRSHFARYAGIPADAASGQRPA